MCAFQIWRGTLIVNQKRGEAQMVKIKDFTLALNKLGGGTRAPWP